MAKPTGLDRFLEAAVAAGIAVEPVRYPAGTRTAADAAAAVGCEVSQIVKSLVLVGPDGPFLALTAGHHRVDLGALADLRGGPVEMADPERAREATGFAIGGTPPFGHPRPLPTYLDPALADHEIVYAAAGTPDSCFPIAPTVLRTVTNATIAGFAAPG